MDGLTVQDQIKELFPEECKKTEPVETDILKRIISWLDSTDIQVQRIVTQLLGDLARIEENRNPIGELVINKVVGFLKTDDLELKQCAARLIGNLSYEHDSNAAALISVGAAPLLVAAINSQDEILQRNSAGALANLASQPDPIKATILESKALDPLITLHTCGIEAVQMMAIRAIRNLSDTDENRESFGKLNLIESCVKLMQSTSGGVKSEALSLLESLLENKTNALHFFRDVPNGLPTILGFCGSSDDEELQDSAAKFLVTLAEQEELKILFKGALPNLLEMVQKEDVKVRKSGLQILAQLVFNNEVMVEVFEHVDKLVALLENVDKEIQLSGAMIIGNLAQTDMHCVKMLETGVVDSILKLMKSDDARVQHLAAGALRNVSIPESNKPKIVALGAFAALIPLLKSTNAHVKFATVGCIKSLLLHVPNRAVFVKEGGLEPLIAIKDDVLISTEEEPDEKKDNRIQLETGRTLVVLLEDEEVKDTFVELDGTLLLEFLMESEFEILQIEGIKGVKLICEGPLVDEKSRKKKAMQGEILEKLVKLVTGGKSVRVQTAALTVLLTLKTEFEVRMAEIGLLEILSTLTTEDPELKELIAKFQ